MFIYFHRNPKTYEIFYVGMATRISRAKDFSPKARSTEWHKYVAECGKPIIEVAEDGLAKKEAQQLEIHYIKMYGRILEGGILVNVDTGGNLGANLVEYIKAHPELNPSFKPEHSARMKANNPMHVAENVEKIRKINTGKKASPETRLKQSLLKKGKPSTQPKGYKHSPETIERLKIINKEIMNRPEVIEKQRLAKIGKRNIKNSASVHQIDINTSQIINTFPSITDALISLGKSIKHGNISQVCKGKRNIAYGYKWQHAC